MNRRSWLAALVAVPAAALGMGKKPNWNGSTLWLPAIKTYKEALVFAENHDFWKCQVGSYDPGGSNVVLGRTQASYRGADAVRISWQSEADKKNSYIRMWSWANTEKI